jgi:hypothetical protein
MKGEMKGLLAGLGIAVLAAGAWFYGAQSIHAPNPQADQAARQMATMPVPGANRIWREVGSKPVLNDSFDVATWKAWTVGQWKQDAKYRLNLHGRFTASDPVGFVVMDSINAWRLQKGDPPLISYTAQASQVINVPWPQEGGLYGFIRYPPQKTPVQMSGSLTGLALQLFIRAAEANRPPARVTAELWLQVDCLCTDVEAQKQIETATARGLGPR